MKTKLALLTFVLPAPILGQSRPTITYHREVVAMAVFDPRFFGARSG